MSGHPPDHRAEEDMRVFWEDDPVAALELDALDAPLDERWTVTDESSAEWALRKIAERRRQATAATATARDLIARHEAKAAEYRAFVNDEESRARKDTDYLTSCLIAWHRSVLEGDPRRKSVPLSGGTLKSRMTPGKVLAVADPEALPEGLRRVEYKPDKAAITAAIKAGDAIPDGVTWEHPQRRFEVEAA